MPQSQQLLQISSKHYERSTKKLFLLQLHWLWNKVDGKVDGNNSMIQSCKTHNAQTENIGANQPLYRKNNSRSDRFDVDIIMFSFNLLLFFLVWVFTIFVTVQLSPDLVSPGFVLNFDISKLGLALISSRTAALRKVNCFDPSTGNLAQLCNRTCFVPERGCKSCFLSFQCFQCHLS